LIAGEIGPFHRYRYRRHLVLIERFSQERSCRYPCGSVWLKVALGDSADDPADELLSSSLLDGELG
jgi:hypothetical protein